MCQILSTTIQVLVYNPNKFKAKKMRALKVFSVEMVEKRSLQRKTKHKNRFDLGRNTLVVIKKSQEMGTCCMEFYCNSYILPPAKIFTSSSETPCILSPKIS